jgi:zinc and cadmium transporter
MESLSLAAFAAFAALVGGFVALKNRSGLNLLLGLTAGLILGLVAFDLLPEISSITQSNGLDIIWPMLSLVTGFLLFHIIEKSILIHHEHEQDYEKHTHPSVGMAGAIALCGHSFLDGVSIGVAFQISNSVGVLVAIAVIGHRFVDGFNTTNVMLFHKNKRSSARTMLFVAAGMPILGALSTLLISPSESVLAIYLGFFAGFLLYIGASEILPQAHSKGSSRGTILMTVLGVSLMFVITRLA